MDTKATEQTIQEITQKIVKEFQPEKIILFGSWAWGKPGPDSDVDLFIIKETPQSRRERQRELRMKLFPPGMPLDLLVYTPAETQMRIGRGDFFIRDIVRKGKTLYESSQRK